MVQPFTIARAAQVSAAGALVVVDDLLVRFGWSSNESARGLHVVRQAWGVQVEGTEKLKFCFGSTLKPEPELS